MSMSRGCQIIEKEKGQWFCIVAHEEGDYRFFTGYNVYGPTKNADDAWREMIESESNPGDPTVIPHNRVSSWDIMQIERRTVTR